MSAQGHQLIQLFTSPPHECSYLAGEMATTAFVDPQIPMDPAKYSDLSRMGFRRSGHYVYQPLCQTCNACIPVRVQCEAFAPKRAFRRIKKRNQDIQWSIEPAAYSDEQYALFENYINQRHRDGEMYPASEKQFNEFLLCDWSDTQFLVGRLDDELVVTAVLDQLDDGCSAVYCYFDPDLDKRSLGTLAILRLIEHCQETHLPYTYLGFYIKNSRKMAYKNQFRPLEYHINKRWVALT